MTPRSHLVVFLLVLCNLAFIVRLVRARKLRAKYAILWLSIAVLLIGRSASPRLLDQFAVWVGVAYGPAAFFLAAISLLFLVLVHFSWELSRLEERSGVSEELALLRCSVDEDRGNRSGEGRRDRSATAQPAGVERDTPQ